MLRDINEKLLHSSNSIWKHGRMWQYVFIDISIQTFQRVVMHTFVRPSSNSPQCSVARLTNPGPHYLKQALHTLESLPFLPSRMLAVDLSLAKVHVSRNIYLQIVSVDGGVAKISPPSVMPMERKKGNPRREDLSWMLWRGIHEEWRKTQLQTQEYLVKGSRSVSMSRWCTCEGCTCEDALNLTVYHDVAYV